MENLLREIIKRLLAIESKLDALDPPKKELKIINRTELCKRLGITEPTVRAGEKKGYIPSFRIGVSVRYNWDDVVNALGAQTKKTNKKPL